jgi:ABC-type amino acid transport substrate-binding protein/serine phosphatase RsbU (regulator of sigma subunit)
MIKILLIFLLAVNLFADVDVALTKLLSATIHSVQNEREKACRVVFKRNDANLQKYKLSLNRTDDALVKLQRFLSVNELSKINIEKQLKILQNIRKLAHNPLNCKKVFASYTSVILFFLDELSNISENSSYKRLLYQYSMFMMYEESILEKELEINAYKYLGNMDKIKSFYLSSSTKEKIFFDVIDKTVTREILHNWHKFIQSGVYKKVQKIENEIDKKIENDKLTLNISVYDELIKKKIFQVRILENELFDLIIRKTKQESLYTRKEINFINLHKKILYVFDPNWKPFEYKDEIGEHRGIIADIIKIIKAKTNLNLIPLATDSWSEAKQLIKEKKADMFSAITQNKKREKFLNFTKHTIFSYDAVLIGKKGEKTDLNSAVIGIKRGYVLTDYIKKRYPKAKIVYFKSLKEGLDALNNSKIDYFVNNIVIAKYYINKKGYTNLTVAEKLPYEFKLKIALRKDEPEIVLNIIDKALGTISKEELNKIYYKWVNANDNMILIKKKDYTLFNILPLKELLIIGTVLIVVVLLMLKYFNKRQNIALGVSVFAFVGLFLASIIIITVISVKNLEKIKKSELAYSLNTILNTTHEALKKILLSQEKYLNFIIQDDSKKTLNKINTLDFINGYLVIDRNYHVIRSSWRNLKTIDDQNLLEGINRAKEYGYTLIFPTKQSVKELRNIFFIKTIYRNFKPVEYIAVAVNKNILQSVLEKGRMGQSGETYLVNVYKQMVSQSRFDGELRKLGLIKKNQNSFLNIKVDTLASRSALHKHNGINTQGYKDYRGVNVFGAWEWDNDYNVAIITEIDEKEAMQSFLNTKTTIYYALFSVVSFVVVLMVFIVWLTNKSKKQLEEKNKALEKFNEKLETLVKQRTQSLEEAKQEIELIHKHTKDSIEFALMLQKALIPDEKELAKCFREYFVIWQPKDIVGGDIWLFEEVREGECVLMVIDCTGHGVPGAFVTMIVKAIEREIISKYKGSKEEISPSYILGYFNKTIKKLLKRDETNVSNAGFDGGVLYINKNKNIIKYSSAKVSLFIVDEEVKVIKGDRYSVGDKKIDSEYVYKEFEFKTDVGTLLYISTDGYIDQMGGEKCFPFGKKRFKKLIETVKNIPLSKQKEIFVNEIERYKKTCQDSEQNDDITLIGIKL